MRTGRRTCEPDRAELGSSTGLAGVLRPPSPPAAVTADHGEQVQVGGVITTRVSWQLGYGPRTQAYLSIPEDVDGPLPAILLLHCHSGNKWVGAERLVDLGGHDTAEAVALRSQMYAGQAPANALAARGFAVLSHDAFGWGSRRFRLDPPPPRSGRHLHGQQALWREQQVAATDEEIYNATAADHENTIAKVATLLGTTFAGMVAHDDLAALQVLRELPMVDGDRVGTMGLSGGGGRAMMLATLSPHIRSHLVCCMMTTLESLLPSYIDAHSWLMYSPGILEFAEWPLIPLHAAAPQTMHVQYASRDELFPLEGMRDADRLLAAHASDRLTYSSSWFDEEHKMTPAMQAEAADFFARTLEN